MGRSSGRARRRRAASAGRSARSRRRAGWTAPYRRSPPIRTRRRPLVRPMPPRPAPPARARRSGSKAPAHRHRRGRSTGSGRRTAPIQGAGGCSGALSLRTDHHPGRADRRDARLDQVVAGLGLKLQAADPTGRDLGRLGVRRAVEAELDVVVGLVGDRHRRAARHRRRRGRRPRCGHPPWRSARPAPAGGGSFGKLLGAASGRGDRGRPRAVAAAHLPLIRA